MYVPDVIEQRVNDINRFFGFQAIQITGTHPTRPYIVSVEVRGLYVISGSIHIGGTLKFRTDDFEKKNDWLTSGVLSPAKPAGEVLIHLRRYGRERPEPFSDNSGDWVGYTQSETDLFVSV